MYRETHRVLTSQVPKLTIRLSLVRLKTRQSGHSMKRVPRENSQIGDSGKIPEMFSRKRTFLKTFLKENVSPRERFSGKIQTSAFMFVLFLIYKFWFSRKIRLWFLEDKGFSRKSSFPKNVFRKKRFLGYFPEKTVFLKRPRCQKNVINFSIRS